MITGIKVGNISCANSGFVSNNGINGSNIGKMVGANSVSVVINGINVFKIKGANSGFAFITGINAGKIKGANSGFAINGSNPGKINGANSGFAINGSNIGKMAGVNSRFIVDITLDAVKGARFNLYGVCRRSLINRDVCSNSIEFIRPAYDGLIRSSLTPCARC